LYGGQDRKFELSGDGFSATGKEIVAKSYHFASILIDMKPLDSTRNRRDALAAMLTDPCEEVRTAAAEALERLEGIGSLPEVLDALKNGGLGTKIKALYALGKIGGEEVLPALLYCAARPEEDIKSVAVEVLGNLANPRTLPVLLERLKEPNPAIRAKAIAALGNFRNPSLIDELVPFLDSGDGLLDAEAVTALARIGDGSLETRFIELLRSPHPQTREAAAHALGELRIMRASS
jgi:HEAT repeat protein